MIATCTSLKGTRCIVFMLLPFIQAMDFCQSPPSWQINASNPASFSLVPLLHALLLWVIRCLHVKSLKRQAYLSFQVQRSPSLPLNRSLLLQIDSAIPSCSKRVMAVAVEAFAWCTMPTRCLIRSSVVSMSLHPSKCLSRRLSLVLNTLRSKSWAITMETLFICLSEIALFKDAIKRYWRWVFSFFLFAWMSLWYQPAFAQIAPCPSLSPQLRDNIHQAATQLAKHIQYNSAGTVEFLVRPDANEFYFLEVNPRVQVEHTISEQITHVDIVQTQIRVALGESLQQLGLVQEAIQPNRLVSIQARVVAENPLNNNMLSVGKINAAQFPQGHGIRVDTWIQPGCVVLPVSIAIISSWYLLLTSLLRIDIWLAVSQSYRYRSILWRCVAKVETCSPEHCNRRHRDEYPVPDCSHFRPCVHGRSAITCPYQITGG